MIYKHEFIDGTLYLYFDYSYEFAKEFNNKDKSFIDQIKNYVKKMKIKLNGDEVIIVVGGIMAMTLILGKNKVELQYPNINLDGNTSVVGEVIDINDDTNVKDIKDEEMFEEEWKDKETIIENTNDVDFNNAIQSNTETIDYEDPVSKDIVVTVYRLNGSVINLGLEEYLIGVVGSEMPASFDFEALKAQAIVARTYTLKMINNNKILTDSVSTQCYKDNYELRNMWGSDFDKYYNKVKSAIESTVGLYITYNGQYIDAVYHSTSNGKTEDSVYVWGNNIPYLKSVDSSWNTQIPSYSKTESKDFDTILNILGIDLNNNEIEILDRNASGRVVSVRIGNNFYSGIELRNLLGLRSTDFDLELSNGFLNITTRGYGHGVGMSQYGANEMAKMGYNYEQILKHYYQGIVISKL